MKQKMPPVRLCLILFCAALLWRVIGAPVTGEDFQNLKTQLWQARTLLPQRAARVCSLWLIPVEKAAGVESAHRINVYWTEGNRLLPMELEDYVCGVVAAEMPASSHLEALKAQAVAARTRALRQMEEGGCALHPGADICTDSAHCQGYAAVEACRALWGDSYEAYRERVTRAAMETRGQVITYEGGLITVLYHAMSGGRTEDASTVFAQSVPYLVSVESGGEESMRGFWQEKRMSYAGMAACLNEARPQAGLTAEEVRRTLSISGYTDTGRVSSVQIGHLTFSGPEFRKALGLRSTWFSLSTDENGVTFQQRGYGHGVGMSQAGANAMAANGAAYPAILAHYYQGTALETR